MPGALFCFRILKSPWLFVSGSVTFNWKSVSGASKYRVYRKVGSGSYEKIGETASLRYTDDNTDDTLTNGKKYTYTVHAIDSSGALASWYYTGGKSIVYN